MNSLPALAQAQHTRNSTVRRDGWDLGRAVGKPKDRCASPAEHSRLRNLPGRFLDVADSIPVEHG